MCLLHLLIQSCVLWCSAWQVSFIKEAGPRLSSQEAFVHGAFLVFIDGVGTGAGVSYVVSFKAAHPKENCSA